MVYVIIKYTNKIDFNLVPRNFLGERDRRDGKALVWAGHVTTICPLFRDILSRD